MSAETVLRVADSEPVWEITLARAKKRNSLNRELHAALNAALRRFDDDSRAHVAILTGDDPAFCAGLDLGELSAAGLDSGWGADSDGTFDQVLRSVSKPVIAAVNGAAITGGLELVLGCDFVIASERALFGDSHARVGVFPGGGMTVLLAQAVGLRMARRMTFTGEFIDAQTALRLGLATEVVAHESLLTRARGVAETIAGNDQALVRATRDAYRRAGNLTVDDALRLERAESEAWVVPAERIAAGRADVMSQRRTYPAADSGSKPT
jgi:enoyl-CoA hydratase